MAAQFKLGFYYDFGIGTEFNKSKAFELYNIAAEKGHITAQYYLGISYQLGEGIDKDEKKAFEIMKNLVEKDEEKENLDAHFQLGYYYDYGIGTEVNKSKAIDLYKVAAKKGDIIAQYILGKCYESGEGSIYKDEEKAFEIMRNLAEKEKEYSDAQFQLGYYYDKGIGTKVNKSKAFELYKIAAVKGHIISNAFSSSL